MVQGSNPSLTAAEFLSLKPCASRQSISKVLTAPVIEHLTSDDGRASALICLIPIPNPHRP